MKGGTQTLGNPCNKNGQWEAPSEMHTFLSLDRGTQTLTSLSNQTQEKRGTVIFFEMMTCRFLRCLSRNLQRITIFNLIDDSAH